MLKLVLTLNGLSCIIFGSIFLIIPANVEQFLGIVNLSWLIPSLGGILCAFAAHLLLAVIRKKIIRAEILYFSFGDLLWVVGSIVVLTSTTVVTTSGGKTGTILVAMLVGTFSALQFVYSRDLAEPS